MEKLKKMARKRVVAFSLPPDVVKKLREEADKKGLSRSSFLTLLLKEYFSLGGDNGGNNKVGGAGKKT